MSLVYEISVGYDQFVNGPREEQEKELASAIFIFGIASYKLIVLYVTTSEKVLKCGYSVLLVMQLKLLWFQLWEFSSHFRCCGLHSFWHHLLR
jgi:hypothetical protein